MVYGGGMSSPSAWRRREFLQAGACAGFSLALGCRHLEPPPHPWSADDLKALPQGAAPAALEVAHFPTRVHAFIWRNWSLVPVARLAVVLRVSASEVREVGAALGLGSPPRIPTRLQKRAYLTIIKRNWHLLPYGQLLELLGWTPEHLAYILREDDFLFIKLGSLKPRCTPLVWAPRGVAIRAHEQWIARTMAAEFGPDFPSVQEPLFQFVDDLSLAGPVAKPAPADDRLRFCYSYFALYGDPLLEPDLDPYPDAYLARLASAGVTGVWLPAVLYKLAEFPWQPGLSEHWQRRRRQLRGLVARARRHGMAVYLYLNEPRAMPLGFFAAHPELKGVVEGDHAALCTSQPEVARYLVSAVASLCREVPDLGGFFTISASENLTNCWSHGQGAGCPRCGGQPPGAVIAGVNQLFQQGIDEVRGRQRLLVWDWGWQDAWVEDIVRRLPPAASLMSVSEWGLPLNRGGVATQVGEYSLSAVGPGPRARRHWALAEARGLRRLAKIQAANSWELSAVPYIPAVARTARHAANLRAAGANELMLGWTLGGYPSPNLEVVQVIMADPGFAGNDPEEGILRALRQVAERRFGAVLAPDVVAAWQQCSTAFEEFPFHIGVVYQAPLQAGPANLLWPSRTGYAAAMVGLPYDDLNAWRGPYPAEVFIGQLELVAEGFASAARRLQSVLAGAADVRATWEARREAGLMQACALHWQSVALQSRYVLLRATAPAGTVPAPEVRALLEREVQAARTLWRLQSADSRLGFEASNQYYYIPLDLAEKVLNCRWLQHSRGGLPGPA